MDWISFFGLNLLALGFIGYLAYLNPPPETYSRAEDLMSIVSSFLLSLTALVGNGYYLLNGAGSLSPLEQLPWILGVLFWCALTVMSLIPDGAVRSRKGEVS